MLKLSMNREKKFKQPRNDCIACSDVGKGKSMKLCMSFGFAWRPKCDMMCPRKSTERLPKELLRALMLMFQRRNSVSTMSTISTIASHVGAAAVTSSTNEV